MALFVFIGRAQNRSDIVKKVAEKGAYVYASTKDFSDKDNISLELIKRLNSGINLTLDVENRANEIFNNNFILNLKNHFVIYIVLVGENDVEADEFNDWPDYFVFKQNYQSVDFIADVMSEILDLTKVFLEHKPFNEDDIIIDKDEMLSANPLDVLSKIPISSLFYLMVSVIKSKSIGCEKMTLEQGMNFLMHFNSVPTKIMPKGFPIYRVRFNKTISNKPILYNQLKELWHPPKSKTNIGRFNRKGKPVLYTADNPLTCFFETHNPNIHGDKGFFTALFCEVNENITEGYISALKSHVLHGLNPYLYYFLKFFKDNITEQERLIKNFLGNYINTKMYSTPNFSYDITNSIIDSIYEGQTIKAIMYPSTKVNYLKNNIVFTEAHAKRYLTPIGVVLYSYSLTKPDLVDVKQLRKGYVSNGRIKYDPS